MSYFETLPGRGLHGFSEGMGTVFPTRQEDAGMRALQQNLQRMGALKPPGTPTGRWDIYTAAALASAKKTLGLTFVGPGFKTASGGGNVDVNDALIAALQAPPPPALPTLPTGPDPSATPSTVPAAFDPTTLTIAPSLPPSVATATPADTMLPASSNTKMYVAIGAAVVVVGGIAAYALWPKKKTTPNRRRRVRRNRRRRTTRR